MSNVRSLGAYRTVRTRQTIDYAYQAQTALRDQLLRELIDAEWMLAHVAIAATRRAEPESRIVSYFIAQSHRNAAKMLTARLRGRSL